MLQRTHLSHSPPTHQLQTPCLEKSTANCHARIVRQNLFLFTPLGTYCMHLNRYSRKRQKISTCLCVCLADAPKPCPFSIMRPNPLKTALPPSPRHILRKHQYLTHYDRSYLIETQKPAMEVFVLNLLQKVLIIDLTRSLIPASAQQRLMIHARIHTNTHTHFRSTLRQYSCFAPRVQLKSKA